MMETHIDLKNMDVPKICRHCDLNDGVEWTEVEVVVETGFYYDEGVFKAQRKGGFTTKVICTRCEERLK